MRLNTILAVLCTAACIFGCKSAEPKLTFDGSGDIGHVLHSGSVAYDEASDTYTISGAGFNCWNEKDDFFFVWKKVSGDFEISGDFAFEGEGVNPHRKTGFMIRESLDTDSKYADVALHGEGLTSLQYRPATGELTVESTPDVWAPTTLAFSRHGNTISFRSGKGSLPEKDDTSIELEFPEECYVGFFMCSHEDDVVETAYVSNIVLKQD